MSNHATTQGPSSGNPPLPSRTGKLGQVRLHAPLGLDGAAARAARPLSLPCSLVIQFLTLLRGPHKQGLDSPRGFSRALDQALCVVTPPAVQSKA
ncbi:hypothetical protein NDU88_002681 [Pleurodeles waltl]|uniref:Uncharacterized protein n=1 Tax=Pleurodeles waltl TaxID=8319 RepID=A0AAV7QAK5_PLEWA|nr:hypothetical protein NDU88_002681 [Pleurodeles waltl]